MAVHFNCHDEFSIIVPDHIKIERSCASKLPSIGARKHIVNNERRYKNLKTYPNTIRYDAVHNTGKTLHTDGARSNEPVHDCVQETGKLTPARQNLKFERINPNIRSHRWYEADLEPHKFTSGHVFQFPDETFYRAASSAPRPSSTNHRVTR